MENGTVVRKYKLWWAWKDDKHEQWLQSMASQGLHLRDANVIGMHRFVRGAPADVAYRWDMGTQRRDPHYRQLFLDAGWEHVTSIGVWHCWRKTRKAGVVTEIYTDNTGRIRRYRKVLIVMCLGALAQLPPILMNSGHWPEWLGGPAHLTGIPAAAPWLNVALLLLLLYGIASIGKRIRDLKQA